MPAETNAALCRCTRRRQRYGVHPLRKPVFMQSRTQIARSTTGVRKPVKARQLAYYDPARPHMEPIVMGRPYSMDLEDGAKILAARERFAALLASDERCNCVVGVFEVEYATEDRITRLRR